MKLWQPVLVLDGVRSGIAFRPFLSEKEAEEFWDANFEFIYEKVKGRLPVDVIAGGISQPSCDHEIFTDNCEICSAWLTAIAAKGDDE